MHWREAVSTSLKKLIRIQPLGLVTDMDGTISPIVSHAEDAEVTVRSRKLLRALARVLPLVAVISGRSAADVRARVGVPGLTYIGNHGLERWVGGSVEVSPEVAAYRPAIQAAQEALEKHLKEGMWVEDKGPTVSIHYRQADEPGKIEQEFRPVVNRIASENSLQFSEGQMVFELRPPVDMDKGTAFRALLIEHELEAALYLGDDVTDVAAFHMARLLRGEALCYALSVGVVSKGGAEAVPETADLLASGVSDVEDLLDWMLGARKASST